MNKYELHISVRNLVEFIFRSGDIDNRFGRLRSADAMQEGSRLHRIIQKSMGEGYQAEVPLTITEESELYNLTIEGRADGIYTQLWPPEQEDGQLSFELLPDESGESDDTKTGRTGNTEPREIVFIDEIKGTGRHPGSMEAPVYVHKAQAMCYAYIFAKQNELEEIGVRMTYCKLEMDRSPSGKKKNGQPERRYFHEVFSFAQLEEWYADLLTQYRKWADFQCRWREKRNASIKELQFPYPYREGQRKLVEDVYRTILRQKNLFLQAPTGVGKTISTVFPAVKAVGEELAEKIFYLTAKTITGTVAMETFGLLQGQGYACKLLRITAKERICPLAGERPSSSPGEAIENEEVDGSVECNPAACPYAAGHFDRVNDAVYELLTTEDVFDRHAILAQANKHRVCPFEMSLDIAEFSDAIVCDYNYVFDPNVALKRFFAEGQKGEYLFLVDEAHNLVERSRKMYSARLVKEELLHVRGILSGVNARLARRLERCNKLMLEYRRDCEDYQVLEGIGTLYFALFQLYSELDEFLQRPQDFVGYKDVLNFYFELRNFMNIYDLVDGHYVVYSQIISEERGMAAKNSSDGRGRELPFSGAGSRFCIRLFCVDPSANLQNCIERGKSTIFFSATLLPINYYKSLLSTQKDNYAVYARSTFSEDQRLLLFGRDVSTRYKRRTEGEFRRMAEYIYRTVRCRNGNYMVFFPSYRLMEEVYAQLRLVDTDSVCKCILQESGMGEQDREEFLGAFEEQKDHPFVAFCVMGGIFGEGIDLKNDRLIGTIIFGTGLPQISDEREILRQYFDKRSQERAAGSAGAEHNNTRATETFAGNGFDFAFRYPGMNKVLQAAGRVIRTAEDVGIILLLDDRFMAREYEPLFPREWERRESCTLATVEEKVRGFWDSVNR